MISLITDRTASDVSRWKELHNKGWGGMTEKEQAEWNTAAMKGAYNYTDLNRVGNAVLYVAGRLEDAGCSVPVSPKIDWTEGDVPTTSSMKRYLDDVATIRAALAVLTTTPPLPDDMEELTYTEANNIEQILLDVNGLIDNMIAAWFYSGDVYSGEI